LSINAEVMLKEFKHKMGEMTDDVMEFIHEASIDYDELIGTNMYICIYIQLIRMCIFMHT
jgi:hypothetical protein